MEKREGEGAEGREELGKGEILFYRAYLKLKDSKRQGKNQGETWLALLKLNLV
jgi:hypothetical protein